jgi:hypothetical protein
MVLYWFSSRYDPEVGHAYTNLHDLKTFCVNWYSAYVSHRLSAYSYQAAIMSCVMQNYDSMNEYRLYGIIKRSKWFL